MPQFIPGELVFAKYENFPLWPGQILCEEIKSKKEAFHVVFFGLMCDMKVVDATSIIRYSKEELKRLRGNTEDHTKPYVKALNEIELKYKENQALSDIKLSRSGSLSPSPSSSSSSMSSASSSSSTDVNVQLKRARKARPNFIIKSTTAATKSKSTSNENRAKIIGQDDIADSSPKRTESEEREGSSMSNLNNSITYTMDLEEINRQLAAQGIMCTFYDVIYE